MDTHAVFTATVLAAIVGTLVMAVYAKKPFVLAPGMGLNAFFVFTVCLTMGYSWQMALTAVLIEGFIFIILSATGIRSMMVDAIPASLKRAIGAGIGLFIAFIILTSVLVIVGLYMMSPIKDIDLNDYAESIPAFITIIMMPLTYSISDGILCGMISYVAINACCGNIKKLSITMWVLAILFVLKYIFI